MYRAAIARHATRHATTGDATVGDATATGDDDDDPATGSSA